jgi:hypothetical protein
MAANALEQSLLSAGGALSGHAAEKKICQAFRRAVRRACMQGKKGKYPKKKFNDLFYEELNKIPGGSALVDPLAREAPAILSKAGAVLAYGGDMAGAPDAAAMRVLRSVTQAGNGAMAATGSFGAMGWKMLTTFWSKRSGNNIRFLDGRLSDGTVLELKGPGDKFHGKQAKDLKAINQGKKPATAACKSCKANCTNEGGGRAGGCGK